MTRSIPPHPGPFHLLVALVLVAATTRTCTDASAGGGGGGSGFGGGRGGGGEGGLEGGGGDGPPTSPPSFTSCPGGGTPSFSLSRELSFDPSDDTVEVSTETESLTFFAPPTLSDDRLGTGARKDDDDHEAAGECGDGSDECSLIVGGAGAAPSSYSSSTSSSSSFSPVSDTQSSALYCSGGDLTSVVPFVVKSDQDGRHRRRDDGHQPSFVAVSECRFNLAMEVESTGLGAEDHDHDEKEEEKEKEKENEEEDDDDDTDDDNDDDDDGHSSMLSNASLRRSLVAANGATGREGGPGENARFSDKPDSKATTNKGRYASCGGKKALVIALSDARAHRRTVAFFPATRNHHDVDDDGDDGTQDGGRGKRHRSSRVRASAFRAALRVRGGAATSSSSDAATVEFIKRLLVAALVTLAYEAVLGHLLEFVKIVMQTSPPGTTYGDVMAKITSEKGLSGCWDGFVPWGTIQALFKGGVFGLAHAVATSLLLPLTGDDGLIPTQLAKTLAGAIGGGVQGYILSPTLLLKTRVMTDPVFRRSMSAFRTTALSLKIGFDVVRDEGIMALMKGSNVFALKRTLDWATRYYFSDLFESILAGRQQRRSSSSSSLSSSSLSGGQKAAASFLGGIASTVSTLPLDVLVAKAQDAKQAGANISALGLLKKDFNENGWKGLYDAYMQGFEARLAHVCFTTVVIKTGTPIVYDLFFGAR